MTLSFLWRILIGFGMILLLSPLLMDSTGRMGFLQVSLHASTKSIDLPQKEQGDIPVVGLAVIQEAFSDQGYGEVTVSALSTRIFIEQQTPVSTATLSFAGNPKPEFTTTTIPQLTALSPTMRVTPNITTTPHFSKTPSPTVMVVWQWSATATRTAIPIESLTPPPTPTKTKTNTNTPSPSPTFTSTSPSTPTMTFTPTATMTLTPTATHTVIPTNTTTVTTTSTVTSTPTQIGSATISATPLITSTSIIPSTPTLLPTTTPTVTNTATRTPIPQPTITSTVTLTTVPTPTLTSLPAPTVSPTVSITPSPFATGTPTYTSTPTQINSVSQTPTQSTTSTQTETLTHTVTPVPTFTITITPSATPTSAACVLPGSVTGLLPSDDTYIYHVKSNTNYGNESTITIRPDFNAEMIGLIKFDLSGIPADATILSANLYLFATSGNATQNYYLYRMTSNWDETTATWNYPWNNTGGDYDSLSVFGNFTIGMDGCAVQTDVTNLINLWVDGTYPNFGLLIKATGPRSSTNFVSKDDQAQPDLHPLLSIVYTP